MAHPQTAERQRVGHSFQAKLKVDGEKGRGKARIFQKHVSFKTEREVHFTGLGKTTGGEVLRGKL